MPAERRAGAIAPVKWFCHPRLPGQQWDDLREPEPEALLGALRAAAETAGVAIVSETPTAGWTSAAHSRDGKQWPCREQTNGAQPAWIWETR